MKNKKLFFYKSAYFLFFAVSLLAIISFCVYAVILGITELIAISKGTPSEEQSLFWACGALLGGLVMGGGLLSEVLIVLCRIIIIDEKCIISNLSIKFKYKSKINLKEISKIDLTFEYRKLRKMVEAGRKKHAFLVIYDLKERAKYFDVNYYSRKQVIKIIDAIRERMQQVGNNAETLSGEELMKNFEEKNDKYVYRISGGFFSK